MKYICMYNVENGKEEIFTFPMSIDHDAMAEVLTMIKNQTYGEWERVLRTPVSAGFVTSTGNCVGESITLGLESRLEDTKILQDQP